MAGFFEGFARGFSETGTKILEEDRKKKEKADELRLKNMLEWENMEKSIKLKGSVDKELKNLEYDSERTKRETKAKVYADADSGLYTSDDEMLKDLITAGGTVEEFKTWREVKSEADPEYAAHHAALKRDALINAGFDAPVANAAALGKTSGVTATTNGMGAPERNKIDEALRKNVSAYQASTALYNFIQQNPRIVGVAAKVQDKIQDVTSQTEFTKALADSLGLEAKDRRLFREFQTKARMMKAQVAPIITGDPSRYSDRDMQNIVETMQLEKFWSDYDSVIAAMTVISKGTYKALQNDLLARETNDPVEYVIQQVPEIQADLPDSVLNRVQKKTKQLEGIGSSGGGNQPSGASQMFDALPNAAQFSGKTVKDEETGKRYKSDGKTWIEQ
jgi:hypothetical protein